MKNPAARARRLIALGVLTVLLSVMVFEAVATSQGVGGVTGAPPRARLNDPGSSVSVRPPAPCGPATRGELTLLPGGTYAWSIVGGVGQLRVKAGITERALLAVP